MKNRRWLLWFIVILSFGAALIALPGRVRLHFKVGDFKIDREISRPKLDIKLGKFRFFRDLEIKQGIDLAGGTHLVFQADMGKICLSDRESAIEAARDNITRKFPHLAV